MASLPEASVWGWALTLVGLPWVAQRVWLMPRRAVERVAGQAAFQLLDAAHFLHDLEAVAVEHGDAARVIAAVFETAQALQQKRLGFLVSEIGDDSTHKRTSLLP